MNKCPFRWPKILRGICIALFLILGIIILNASAVTIDLPKRDGGKVTMILPEGVPPFNAQYMQVIHSKTHNLTVLRIFYEPDKQFQRDPYLHFYDFIAFQNKAIVLGLIQYLNGNERYWIYDTEIPKEVTLKEFSDYVDKMLSLDVKNPNREI